MADDTPKPNPLVELWKREIAGMREHAIRDLAVYDLTLDENDNIVPINVVPKPAKAP